VPDDAGRLAENQISLLEHLCLQATAKPEQGSQARQQFLDHHELDDVVVGSRRETGRA
jgi:hypothetical protein